VGTVIFPHTVTILRAGQGTDEYGDAVVDWTSSTATASPAWVQPRTTSEENANRSAVLRGMLAFLPPGVSIRAHDRLAWDGRTYEVNGEPATLWNPSGPHHIEAPLTLVEG
jgi:hypothetical protein